VLATRLPGRGGVVACQRLGLCMGHAPAAAAVHRHISTRAQQDETN
jgi:hypothetical protein